MRKIFICNKKQFADLESAMAYAAHIHARRGVFVAIEAKRVRAR